MDVVIYGINWLGHSLHVISMSSQSAARPACIFLIFSSQPLHERVHCFEIEIRLCKRQYMQQHHSNIHAWGSCVLLTLGKGV